MPERILDSGRIDLTPRSSNPMISIVCALTLLVPPNSGYEVAYVAKYYASKAKDSYFQVYLTNLQGKAPQCLTNNKSNYSSTRWISSDQLAFIEQTSQGFVLWTYNLKEKTILRVKAFAKADSPKLMTHPALGYNQCILRLGSSTHSYYQLDSSGILPIKNPETSAFQYRGSPLSINSRNNVVNLVSVQRGEKGVLTWMFENKGVYLSLYSNEGEGYFEVYPDQSSAQTWLTMWSGNGKAGYATTLYHLDWQKGTALPVISGVENLSFHVDSRYWTATSPYRRYQRLADGTQAQINDGIIGDRTTQTKWTITDGPCFVRSIAILPGM